MKKIKQLKTYQQLHFPDATAKNIMLLIAEYTESGLLTKEVNFDLEGEIISVLENTYDKTDRILESKVNYVNENAINKTEYFYKRNLLIRKVEYYNESDFLEERYIYDNESKLAELYKEDNDGIFGGKILYEKNDVFLKEKHFDEKNSLFHEKEIHQNSKGKTVLEIERYYYEDSSSEMRTSFDYNKTGNLRNVKMYEDEKLIVNENYYYNKLGKKTGSLGEDYEDNEKIEIKLIRDSMQRQIRKEQLINNILSFYRNRTYDSNNQIIEEETWELNNNQGREESKFITNEIEYY